jgi:exopolysaccharide biosynthesis polyprenyl glycosylphosphotransferase
MDPVQGEIVRAPVRESVAGTATRERRHWARPEPRVVPEPSHLHLEKPAAVRLRLQRRAPANLRHHFVRAAVRFSVLLVADLASFGLMRELVRAVRGFAVVGGALAGRLEAMLPPGILNGWQYAAALFMGLLVTGNYGRGDQRRDPRRLFLGAALATALPLWMTIWTRGLESALLQYGLVTVLVWIGLVLERRTINQVMAWVRPPERDRMDVLFVGPGADCLEAIQTPAFSRGADYRPVGFVDTRMPPAGGALGHLSDLPTVLDASGAKAVVISGYLTEPQFRQVVDTALAGGCQVLSVPRSVQIAGVHPTTVWRRGQPLVELTAPGLKGWQLVVKRVMDIAGATLGLVLLSPVFALVAALVKLDSPGPVFFTQERVGGGGRRFRIIKFRTMVDGAENRRDELLSRSLYSDPRLFKVPNDPRMTRLGRWLRRTSVDELPQLINVLRGEMALVGPRPPLPSEAALYEGHHYARFDVKPGITGPWQVAGRNGVTAFEQVLALETAYIQNWSVWADLQLLVKTVPVVVLMRGAY